MMLKLFFLGKSIPYTGKELRPHWIYEQTREFGSAIVAFRGSCQVHTEDLVDLEDASAGAEIRAAEMLHFIGEFFGSSLEYSIVKQRLLISTFTDTLRKFLPEAAAAKLTRSGDDIYFTDDNGRRKFSVSIVTASSVSTLLHFGVNINPSGAPVAAIGLNEFAMDIPALVEEVFRSWKEELSSLAIARCKVLPR